MSLNSLQIAYLKNAVLVPIIEELKSALPVDKHKFMGSIIATCLTSRPEYGFLSSDSLNSLGHIAYLYNNKLNELPEHLFKQPLSLDLMRSAILEILSQILEAEWLNQSLESKEAISLLMQQSIKYKIKYGFENASIANILKINLNYQKPIVNSESHFISSIDNRESVVKIGKYELRGGPRINRSN